MRDSPQLQPPINDDRTCRDCPKEDNCRNVWAAPRRGPFGPVGLVAASGLAFLLPLTVAVIAGAGARIYAAASERSTILQVTAVILGLLVGALIARLIVPLIRNERPPDNTG